MVVVVLLTRQPINSHLPYCLNHSVLCLLGPRFFIPVRHGFIPHIPSAVGSARTILSPVALSWRSLDRVKFPALNAC